MNNVLVLSAGRRVSLVRAFQAELKKIFPDAKVFAADMNPALSSACQVADGCFSVPAARTPDYAAAVLALCERHGIGLVLPTIDTELLPLAAAREQFSARGVSLVISSTELVTRCRDKRLTAGLFAAQSVQTPEIYDPADLRFPCFAKPLDGSRSQNLHVIRTSEQLPPGLVNDSSMIFMRLIERALYHEYTADMYYDRHHALRCVVPRRRIEVRDGEVSKGVTDKGAVHRFLWERFSVLEGAVGCITLQLFLHREHDDFLGIEVNPRFGGGYPLSYQAGANFPGWLIREYLCNESVATCDTWEDGLLMLRYDAEVLVHGFAS
jgi:carbamoyl-phosphate synthase large subunit